MTLIDYIKKHDLKVAQFARRIGCTRVYISMIMHGKKKPGNLMCKAIIEASEGEVTMHDILSSYRGSNEV